MSLLLFDTNIKHYLFSKNWYLCNITTGKFWIGILFLLISASSHILALLLLATFLSIQNLQEFFGADGFARRIYGFKVLTNLSFIILISGTGFVDLQEFISGDFLVIIGVEHQEELNFIDKKQGQKICSFYLTEFINAHSGESILWEIKNTNEFLKGELVFINAVDFIAYTIEKEGVDLINITIKEKGLKSRFVDSLSAFID